MPIVVGQGRGESWEGWRPASCPARAGDRDGGRDRAAVEAAAWRRTISSAWPGSIVNVVLFDRGGVVGRVGGVKVTDSVWPAPASRIAPGRGV